MTMSKHVVEPKPQTTDDNMAHARRKLDTLGYTHTHTQSRTHIHPNGSTRASTHTQTQKYVIFIASP
jgi:hypothetical protein